MAVASNHCPISQFVNRELKQLRWFCQAFTSALRQISWTDGYPATRELRRERKKDAMSNIDLLKLFPVYTLTLKELTGTWFLSKKKRETVQTERQLTAWSKVNNQQTYL